MWFSDLENLLSIGRIFYQLGESYLNLFLLHKVENLWSVRNLWSISTSLSALEDFFIRSQITLCKSRNISLWIPLLKVWFGLSVLKWANNAWVLFICFKTSRGSLHPVCLVICLEVQRVFFTTCFRRWPKLLQEKLRWPHLNGFSLECFRMCIFREPAWVQEW